MNTVASAEVTRRMESFRAAARAVAVKLTHQRLEIFREVAASLEHPDADAVFRGVRKRVPTVSLDTVYRTLWLLHDLGVIATLGPRRESARFDANLAQHHHYCCVRCGLARDFESPELNALRIPDSVGRLGRIVATRVEVRGVCGRCAGEPAAASTRGSPRRSSGKKKNVGRTREKPHSMMGERDGRNH